MSDQITCCELILFCAATDLFRDSELDDDEILLEGIMKYI